MGIKARTRLNRLIDGTGLAEIHGDRFRPGDYLMDKSFLQGKMGDFLELITNAPSIISGLVVTQGTGDTIDITAGSALVYDDQTPTLTPHNYDGSALTPEAITEFITGVLYAGTTNLAIPSAVLDGVTVNYVKLSVVDVSQQQRGPADDPGTPYDFFMREGVQITVDDAAPSSTELLLATFTGVAAGSFIFAADPESGERAFPFGLRPDGGKLYVPVTGLEVHKDGSNIKTSMVFDPTADRTLEIPDRDSRIGAVYAWSTGENFEPGDFTIEDNKLYWCLVSHTAGGSFDADVGSGYWVQVGGGSSLEEEFNQVSPSFVIGTPVYFDGADWQPAQADDGATIATAVISSVSGSDYVAQYGGAVELTTGEWDAIAGTTGGLTAGETYYVSDTTAGEITSVLPAIENPVYFALSATRAIVMPGFQAAESGAGDSVVRDTFTGDGSTDTYALSAEPRGGQFVFAFVGGAINTEFTLVGNQLTFDTPPALSADIVITSIISTTFSKNIEQFVQRETVALADDGQEIINSTSIFPTVSGGVYELFDQNDPTTYARFSLKQDTPPVVVLRESSADVDIADTDGYLCLFLSGNDLILKNRLGTAKTFVIHRLL